MNKNESSESIIQNLKDAGCDSETIERFMTDLQKGEKASSLKLLAAHPAGKKHSAAKMSRLLFR